MTITPESAEFNASQFYADLGELSSNIEVDDNTSIKLNGKTYNHKNKDISVGNNGHIKAPIFEIKDNHLLVSNLYLAIEAINGVTNVECGKDVIEVSLDGLNNGKTLTMKNAKGVNTQTGRINSVVVSGNNITQTSNNGKHIVAITLESDGVEITNPSDIVYSLGTDGNLGMTSPESTGNNGEYYTYGMYTKYKNGDYTAADATDRMYQRKLIIPGKGSVDITITLHAKEYTE